MTKIKIGKTKIGKNEPCFVVAELSGNHDGKLSNAIRLVRVAAKAGVNAIKLQTYTADTITLNTNKKDFVIPGNSPWKKNENFWKLYNKAHTPWEWHKKIFKEAARLKLEVFSSPFDESAVDFLEKINCPAYKVASPEINHLPLIEKIAKTKKPIIISTGLASLKEIDEAVKLIHKCGNHKIMILKCTTSYPAEFKDLNLNSMLTLQKKFNKIVGFSDHTKGITAALAATAIGAKIIEKHLKLKHQKSVDDFFSLDEKKFKDLVRGIRDVEKILGSKEYSISKSSEKHLVGKRSIYVSKKIKKGEKIDIDNIKVVRPNKSLLPKFYKKILGLRVTKNLDIGDRLRFNILKK
mgnify:CR=1 FL=1